MNAPALDRRAKVLLKSLVERYIADGQPVGSRALSKYSGLELSPATVRNVMSDLEEMGFIASPHTSAGRVPTALGYRFFVDCLLTVRPLSGSRVQELEEQLQRSPPQQRINSASQILSQLTHFAGVVVAPRRAPPRIRRIEFLGLSERRVLLIVVTQEGDVQNRILHTERAYSAGELERAANYLDRHFQGLTFEEIRVQLHDELRQLRSDVSELMNAAIEAGGEALAQAGDQCAISGESNLLDVEDLSCDMARLRKLFSLFEQKSSLIRLLDLSSRAAGVQLFIGGESGIAPLDECSVVAAHYEVDGELVGTVGVIGPTRMAYERVIPIVDITARLLSGAHVPQ